MFKLYSILFLKLFYILIDKPGCIESEHVADQNYDSKELNFTIELISWIDFLNLEKEVSFYKNNQIYWSRNLIDYKNYDYYWFIFNKSEFSVSSKIDCSFYFVFYV